jgi:hypothetical protein
MGPAIAGATRLATNAVRLAEHGKYTLEEHCDEWAI